MTLAECSEVFSYLGGSYFLGWCLGYSILTFKQFAEKI